jgi:aryl-alcohol dehydrogenase-like predicted oxidoreductase
MSTFPQRKIGNDLVSAIGLGCMGMAIGLPNRPVNDEESLKVLTAAVDMGITFWDTSDAYGNNERLIGRWFQETGRRDEIFLATKFGVTWVDGKMVVKGTADYVKNACAVSLERLGTDRIDLYYQHRVDKRTPIEETVKAMAELKAEGKIRYLGLSECSANTLRRASKVHYIAAAQMEFSPFALEIESPETDFLCTARELGVKIVVYAPLGKGFLTGAVRSRSDLDPDDPRTKTHPRFSEENFASNLKLVEGFDRLAKAKGYTTGQVALAWVMAQGEGESDPAE